jgi:hypothetical protein
LAVLSLADDRVNPGRGGVMFTSTRPRVETPGAGMFTISKRRCICWRTSLGSGAIWSTCFGLNSAQSAPRPRLDGEGGGRVRGCGTLMPRAFRRSPDHPARGGGTREIWHGFQRQLCVAERICVGTRTGGKPERGRRAQWEAPHRGGEGERIGMSTAIRAFVLAR